MKIKVQCEHCLTIFDLPAVLQGQTVKCRSCGEALKAEPMKADDSSGAAGIGNGALLGGDLFSPNANQDNQGQIGGEASGLMPGGMAGGQPSQDQGQGQEGFPGAGGTGSSGIGARRGLKAEDLGVQGAGQTHDEMQSRMERLYGMYAGEELQKGKKGKFTLGLGVALAVICIGVVGGGYLVWQTLGDSSDVGGTVADGPKDAQPIDIIGKTISDEDEKWEVAEDAMLSELSVAGGEVFAKWQDRGRQYGFEMRVTPSKSDREAFKGNIRGVLYRSLTKDGDYVQVDKRPVGKMNHVTGELVFEMKDNSFMDEEKVGNFVYYRLVVLDREGKRVIDSPVGEFPVVRMPLVKAGRVKWNPMAEGVESGEMTVKVYLDMPGWDHVLIHRVASREGISEMLPDTKLGAPMRVMMSCVMPVGADITDTGLVNWQVASNEELIRRVDGESDLSPVGLLPVYGDGDDVVDMVPNVREFENLTVEQRRDMRGNLLSRGIMFKPKVSGDLHEVSIAYAGQPTDMTVVPYEDEVKLSWDGASVAATASAYADPMGYAVYRVSGRGERKLLDVLNINVSEYRDTQVEVNGRYRYEVVVVPIGSPNDDGLVKSNAWVADVGELPVLVAYRPRVESDWVKAEQGLAALNIVLGQSELVYSGSSMETINGLDAISEVLRKEGNVQILDRTRVGLFYDAMSRNGVKERDEWQGLPAHLEFVFVDESRVDGTRVALWVKDFMSGGKRKLYEAKVGELSLTELALAVKKYVSPLKRSGAFSGVADAKGRPVHALVGPIVMADQMRKYYGADRLAAELEGKLFEVLDGVNVSNLRESTGLPGQGTLMLTGRVWLDDAGEAGITMRGIDVSTGEVIGEKRINVIDEGAMNVLGEWVRGLQVSKQTRDREDSVLIGKEKMMGRLHQVWAQMGGVQIPMGLDGEVYVGEFIGLGAERPAALSCQQALGVRDENDPLLRVKPFVGGECSLLLDDWVAKYASYVEADFKGFQMGYQTLIDRLKSDEDLGRVYVRGQLIEIDSRMKLRGSPRQSERDIVLTTVLPGYQGEGSGLDYFTQLSKDFEAAPYAAGEAWGRVDEQISLEFLKGVVHGVDRGRFGTLPRKIKRPPSFAKYVAARKLFGMGHREAVEYVKNVARICTFVQRNLGRAGAVAADHVPVQNAILILMYEKDPETIKRMNQRSFRKTHFPSGEATADMMRMFIDADEQAWEWVDDGFMEGVDWQLFKWRSVMEMRMITDEKPDLFTEAHYVQMRDWLGAPIQHGIKHRMRYPETVGEPSIEFGVEAVEKEKEEVSSSPFDFLN
ncbi:hypothetical protein KS4_29390 [Poriferisphaera corsica]|uniref:Uncharacterized protein n=1 Tax=Poriferisphaera corsica TaxID=2528020 RepID=A0A517YXD2_9BACT|nr:hypothetical protein [Poriferisphaera corsica]QDU34863.1 hypothetical protein KS4_29390 [Poriferisphaera corsica]